MVMVNVYMLFRVLNRIMVLGLIVVMVLVIMFVVVVWVDNRIVVLDILVSILFFRF